MMQRVSPHPRQVKRNRSRIFSSSRGKTVEPEVGKLLIKSDTEKYFRTNLHF